MRCDKCYLNDVIEYQGDFFVLATESGYELCDFTEKYLKSKTRQYIDDGQAYYCTMMDYALMDSVKKEPIFNSLEKTEKWQDDFISRWVGEFYALAQWKWNIPSMELLKKVPVRDLLVRYNVLHDIDLELAVNKMTNY